MSLPLPISKSWLRSPWLTTVAIFAAIFLAVVGGEQGRWLAAGLAIVGLPWLKRLFLPLLGHRITRQLRRRLAPYWPHILVGSVVFVLLGDLLLGHPPASRDHGIHYFQTHVLVHDLIPRGVVQGWTDALNSGYPFGDNYPVLGYLWVGFLHLASGEWISLRTSYALGLLSIWGLSIWGLWAVAAWVQREIELGEQQPTADGATASTTRSLAAWAGAIAALFWLLDPGASRQGGWNYLIFHGVWPQQLSTALWIASFPLTLRALQHPSPRRLAMVALSLGASVLAHPFGLLTVACSATAWPLILWATGSLRRLPTGALRWCVVMHLLALLVCGGWVIGFLASAQSMARSPVTWLPLGELAIQLLTGELFLQHGYWVGPLAVIGIVVVGRSSRARPMGWMLLFLLAGILVLGSESSVTVLHLDLLVSAFKNLQFPRYAIALKPLWCGLAGVGFVALLPLFQSRSKCRKDRDSTSWPLATRAIAALCFAPLLVSLLQDFDRLATRPVGGLLTLEKSIHGDSARALGAALNAESRLIDAQPLVVAFLRQRQGEATYPLFELADLRAKVVLDGHIPAVNYRHQVRGRSAAALRSMGVTHVIWMHELPIAERELKDALIEIDPEALGLSGFGRYRLARLRDPKLGPELFLRSSDTDDSTATIVAHHDAYWQVRLEGLSVAPDANQTLGFTIGPYRKWNAYDETGRALEIRPRSRHGGVPSMDIKLPPGPPTRTVTLRYETPSLERAATLISAIVLLMCTLGLFSGRALTLTMRLRTPWARRSTVAIAMLGLCLLCIALMHRADDQLDRTWQAITHDLGLHRSNAQGLPQLVEDRIAAGNYKVHTSNSDGCDGLLTKNAQVGCSDAGTRPQVGVQYRAPFIYRCLRVQVPALGQVSIRFEDIAQDQVFAGFLTRRTPRRGKSDDLTFTTSARSRPQSLVKKRKRAFFALPQHHNGSMVVEIQNARDQPEQVCIAAATLR